MISTSEPMDSLCIPRGFQAAGIAAGIKRTGARDLALICSTTPATCAAVFTTNQVAAAPVLLSRQSLRINDSTARAVIISSGNANAATGEEGLRIAQAMCQTAAHRLGCSAEHVLIGQTGLIGIPLPEDRCIAGVDAIVSELSYTGWRDAAAAMMTTDTFPKTACATLVVDNALVSILGIAKGVAMHKPNMATMLAVFVTDADISPDALQSALALATDRSFHCVNIDGCQSTNDSVFCLANGASGGPRITNSSSEHFQDFTVGFTNVARSLARQMARDAEGGKKLIICKVQTARTEEEARLVVRQILGSMLVKTALAGSCAYWGRVLAEVGASPVAIDPNRVDIAFGEYMNCLGGQACSHDKVALETYMQGDVIEIFVDLNLGDAEAEGFGSDLTHEYVSINMDKS